jgi:ELWxxDGT repeat protein
MVLDIRSGPQGSDPRFLINFNDVLIFTAYDDATGNEIWRSMGTPTTTVLLKDINPGTASSNPCQYVVYNNKLYFQADNGVYVALSSVSVIVGAGVP